MGPFGIVLHQPGIHRSAHLRQITERVGIEHFSSERAVEPFNVRILSGLPRLDPMQDHVLIRAPILQGLTNEPLRRPGPVHCHCVTAQAYHSTPPADPVDGSLVERAVNRCLLCQS